MNQRLRIALILLLAGLFAPPPAFAQDDPAQPTDPDTAEAEAEAGEEEDEEEQAAKHFAKGRSLYKEGKYKEAIEELLKAYTLRPAPPILLNIARTYEKLDDKTNALKYYKEFLLKARMVDPNRARVEGVVKTLEKEVHQKTGAVTSAEGTDTPAARATPEQGITTSSAIQQLIHTPVDAAKVRMPVTILTELPPMVEADRVVVHFRKAGEMTFRKIELEAQGEAYVTRIPASHITSTSLQYFIEALKGKGRRAVVATAGTKTNPHIIVIEGGRAPTIGPVKEVEIRSPYRDWFWYSAIGAAVLLGTGITFTVLAGDRAGAMEKWVNEQSCGPLCQDGRGEPAKPFDIKARDWESQGKTFSALGAVMIGLGAAAAGATGYLWYKDREYVKAERRRLQASQGVRFVGAPWANHSGFGVMGRVTF